jgi:hypothetical protein
MTDSRLPDRWLMNPIMRELSDTDWRVYTWGLMQSNNQQTDSYIPASALVLLHPDGRQPESYERLCAVGLWEQVPSGYQAIDWGNSQTLSSAQTCSAGEQATVIASKINEIETLLGPTTLLFQQRVT